MLIRPGRVGALGRTRRGPLYDPYLEQLLVAMGTTPPADVRGYMNDLIVGLRTDAVWPFLDDLRIWAADTADNACYNWVNPTAYKATPVNSPTFTAYRGFTGDGATSYVNTTWAPSNGANYQLNDCCLFGHSLTSARSSGAMMGTMTGATAILQPRDNTDNFGFRLNNAAPSVTTANADGSGFYAAERTGASAMQGYKDGAAIGSAGTVVSSSRSGTTISIGRANNVYSVVQVAVSGASASLGAIKQMALRNRSRTYLQRVGAVA